MAKRKGTKLSRAAARVGAEGVSRSRRARLTKLAERLAARGKGATVTAKIASGQTRQDASRAALAKMGAGKKAGISVTGVGNATRLRRLAIVKLAAAAGTGG